MKLKHQQRQGQYALRVRRESYHRHHNRPAPGGQSVAYAKALPDNPHDGHTLWDVIEMPRSSPDAHRACSTTQNMYARSSSPATDAAFSAPDAGGNARLGVDVAPGRARWRGGTLPHLTLDRKAAPATANVEVPAADVAS
jgi:hypothetical protein